MSCLTGSAELIRKEIQVGVAIDCTDTKTNVLCASDGVLYSSEPEPLFANEYMGRLTQSTEEIQEILNDAVLLSTPDTDEDVEAVWANVIND
jgi:hypothetical protein